MWEMAVFIWGKKLILHNFYFHSGLRSLYIEIEQVSIILVLNNHALDFTKAMNQRFELGN